MGQSVIEINGTRYDATTGRVISDMPKTPAMSTTGRNIDGIVIKSTPQSTALAPTIKKHTPAQRQIHDVSMTHSTRTNRSKTLMRSVVKKPGSGALGHTSPTQHQYKTQVEPSASYAKATSHDVRLTKALSTPTHGQISRFTHPSNQINSSSPTVVHNMPVAQQVSPRAVHTTSQPSPAYNTPQNTAGSRFVDSQLTKVASQNGDESPFKKKPLHKRVTKRLKANRMKSIAMGSLASLLIGGFLVYQNLPSITLAVANREAGITAKIPKGVPSNFALSPSINKSQGQVLLSFDSRTDDRSFVLTQVKSDTTVETLKETVARLSDNKFQTYEVDGITLFLHENNRVDWIDGGMRYNLSGNTGFTPDQLGIIASSL